MKTVLALLAVSFVASLAAAQAPPPKPAADPSPTALVVIDVQNIYFPGGRVALADPLPASLQAKRLLERFRAKGWPVVHVQHLPKGQAAPSPETGDESYRIHVNVLPVAGETVVGKHHANAFRDTDLLAVLRRVGARRLVIAGMQTHMCVEAATRAAAALAAMDGTYARVVSTDQLLAELE